MIGYFQLQQCFRVVFHLPGSYVHARHRIWFFTSIKKLRRTVFLEIRPEKKKTCKERLTLKTSFSAMKMVISPHISHAWTPQTALKDSQLQLVYVFCLYFAGMVLYLTIWILIRPTFIVLWSPLYLFLEWYQHCLCCEILNFHIFSKAQLLLMKYVVLSFLFALFLKSFHGGNNGTSKKHMVCRLY